MVTAGLAWQRPEHSFREPPRVLCFFSKLLMPYQTEACSGKEPPGYRPLSCDVVSAFPQFLRAPYGCLDVLSTSED